MKTFVSVNECARLVSAGLGWIAVTCATLALGLGLSAQAEDAKVDFYKDIAPIFAASCVKCHGPEKQKCKLRLDTPEAITLGSENGPIVVAGKPGESTLCKLVSLPPDHPDRMPVNADPLTPEQVALIAKWIEQGAVLLAADGAPAPAPAPTTEPAAATDTVDFVKDVYPIFVATCIKCHGPEKQKGDLRLDSVEAIKTGGENGPVVVAGKPGESKLCLLISKPAGDADIMPANGDPLTPDQIALVAKWIEQGAVLPETLPDAASTPAPTASASPAAAAGSEALAEEQLLAKLAEGVQPAAAEVLDPVKQIGGLAMPLDLKSPLLSVNLQYGADKVNDDALAALAALAPQVTWLNLAGTKVTDAGLQHIASLNKLTRLHLERTEITDAGITNLQALENLQYLNVYGTKVSDASVDALAGMKALKKLYVWNSQITKDGAAKLTSARPDLYVNVGIDETAVAAASAPTLDLALFNDADGCCAKTKAEGKDCDHPCCVEAKAQGVVCAKCNPIGAKKAELARLFDADGCCAKALAAGAACDHACCIEAAAKGEICAKCNPNGAKAVQVAKFDVDSCCAKAAAEGKACDHPCCVEALAKGELCAKCNPNKAREKLAMLFDKDSCCAKAAAEGKDCEHPCCVEARAKGEVCAKCNAEYAKTKLSALFDKDSCCSKAVAEGKDCEHPCCVEARAKGEVCAKCNAEYAKTKLSALFDKDSCCAKAAAEAKDCEHPCCVEARAKGEVCAKCNAEYAKTKLSALFDADGCCAKALAEAKACEHPCCVEARGKGELCTKCNPGAAAKLKAESDPKPAEAAKPPEAQKPAANVSTKKVASLSYNRVIHPILADNCFTCHGPDKGARKADLRLDTVESAVETREGRAAIVPGNSGASELVRRITSTDADDVMPPTNSGHALKPEQIALLTQWIDAGAEYEPHWSYLAVVRPEVPQVSGDSWAKNPIDRFVLARLEAQGVAPSPEADRVTLIRRASIDLTGLPPTPEDVDAFVNDVTPEAYEKLIDRLLESPHYGERMALSWLDWVRYADTNGYHGDEPRSVWPYRDYVIRAFNENMPFDRFTIEQLAGDLLPNATREQKIASGYNRLNQLTAEGGAQPAEYVQKYMADRIRTTTSVWMGSTFGCAECHDHKFDPISMKDFYSFGAFFADIDERGVYTAGGPWDPTMELPNDDQAAEKASIETAVASLQQTLDTPTEALATSQQAWESELRADLSAAHNDWTALLPESMTAEGGTKSTTGNDLIVTVSGGNPETNVYTVTLPVNQPLITGMRLELFTNEKNGKLSRAGGNGNIVLTGFEVSLATSPDQLVPIASAQADYEQKDFPIAAAIDADPASGWAVSGHEIKGQNRYAVFSFAEPIAGGTDTKILVRLKQQSTFPNHTILKFRLSATTVDAPRLASAAGADPKISEIVLSDAATRTAEAGVELAAYYRGIAPELEQPRAELKAQQDRLAALKKEISTMLVSNAIAPHEVKILPRGNFLDTSGEVVQPGTPHFLPQLQIADRRQTRLDLAQWLVSRENPLTARTMVNRLWEMYYGTGLSKVLDDLGARGEWPVNPDALDWLAAEFMDSGWDVKHVARLMVTSSAYRQSSHATPELLAVDPFNRLYARQATYRLAAEGVRDSALQISGLLSPKIGGRNVYPYQPEGYYSDCNTFSEPASWFTSPGEDQYRRGMYTFWKRTFLHPSMLAFDAPTREECTAERVISNTPLQALALLNDPSYVEASRVFAERIVKEGGATAESRIQYAFRRALSRMPSAEEIAVLTALCQKHYDEFSKDTESAALAVSVGQAPVLTDVQAAELAAWTSVARTILNLHETITRA